MFIDARNLGRMESRVHRVLDEADISKVAGAYHSWRDKDGNYEDIAGFCRSASIEEIKGHEFVLTPGRYVGAEDVEDDGEPFEEKMERLAAELDEQFAHSSRLETAIRSNLKGLGYGG